MPGRETFPRDAEEARLDVELTREELGETVEALADKARQTAHTGQRAALTAGAVISAGILLVVLIKKISHR